MSVFVIRTHYFDEQLCLWARRLSEKCEHVVFVVDETEQSVDVAPEFTKLSLNREILAKMGLAAPPRVGWQCGDYALYLARQAFPQADFYWLIEPDILINMRDLKGFFAFFEQFSNVDFLACYFYRANRKWFWHAAMSAVTNPVFHCLFPIVRASARALELMHARRVELSKQFSPDNLQEQPYLWPNDESFSATTCVAGGLDCRDINSFGRKFYTDETFSYDRPRSARHMEQSPSDNMLYHPVLSGERFLEKARGQLAIRRGRCVPRALAVFNPAFMRELAAECGPARAAEFQQEVDDAIDAIKMSRLRKRMEITTYRLVRPVLLRLRLIGRG